jgi:hypothetical protein
VALIERGLDLETLFGLWYRVSIIIIDSRRPEVLVGKSRCVGLAALSLMAAAVMSLSAAGTFLLVGASGSSASATNTPLRYSRTSGSRRQVVDLDQVDPF